MSRSTFRVLFYLKRNAPKKNGLVPVMCRITVNGKISQFSCKLDVEEKLWNVNLGRMSGRSVVAQEANRMLDKIRVGINKAYQDICDKDNYVTAEKVRNAFLGMGMNHETLLAVFRQHNEDYAKQVGKIKSQRSYWKYCTVYNNLEEFIKRGCVKIPILFFFRRKNPSLKETAILYLPQTGRLAVLPAIRQAHMQAIQPYRLQV